jgi:hypothetical protein
MATDLRVLNKGSSCKSVFPMMITKYHNLVIDRGYNTMSKQRLIIQFLRIRITEEKRRKTHA